MRKRLKRKDNLLDAIPSRNEKIGIEYREHDLVVLVFPRDRFLERLVRKFKKTPTHTRIALDAFGSFVWNAIDGHRTIYEIGVMLKEHYGDEIEPVYERLSKFLQLLKQNKFAFFALT